MSVLTCGNSVTKVIADKFEFKIVERYDLFILREFLGEQMVPYPLQ